MESQISDPVQIESCHHSQQQQEFDVCPCVEFQSIHSIYNAIARSSTGSKSSSCTVQNEIVTDTNDTSQFSLSSSSLSSPTEAARATTDLDRLMTWIRGSSSSQQYRCHRSCCLQNRAKTSVEILNAIRRTVQPYLQQQQQQQQNHQQQYQHQQSASDIEDLKNDAKSSSFKDDEFSSFTNSNTSTPIKPRLVVEGLILHPRQLRRNTTKAAAVSTNIAKNIKSTQKRRIRPIAVTTADNGGPFQTTTMSTTTITGNLTNLPNANDEFPSLLPTSSLTSSSSSSFTATNVWNRPLSSSTSSSFLKVPMEQDKDKVIMTNPSATIDTPKKLHNKSTNYVAYHPTNNDATARTPTMVTPCKKNNDCIDATRTCISKPIQPEAKESIESCPSFQSLILLYSSLIQYCLVPSTILEIHLLLKLLTLPDHHEYTITNNNTNNNNMSFVTNTTSADIAVLDQDDFATILSSSRRCLYFAVSVLRKQSMFLQGLGIKLIRNLVRCTVFCRHLPDIVEQLTASIQQYDTMINVNVHSIIDSSTHQTAHLTLPFKPERDSRHNFRTRDEQAVYKNREECRDAFLYQLRAFVQMKGTMMDSTEANRIESKLRHSSRTIMNNLWSCNVPWFTEVFVEMIMQIGHVTLQQTDQDPDQLLHSVDKEKLQKLNDRLSSKSASTTGTITGSIHTRSMIVDHAKRDTKTPPITEAQHCFTGYQEFFFLFMMFADSYKLSVHLRSSIITKLKDILKSNNAFGQETKKEILDTRLLARFLGVILFSPNWKGTNQQLVPTLDELSQIAAVDLSIIDCVREGLEHDKLLLMVSWIVELLKMAKWDLSLMKSKICKETLAMIRQVQIRLSAAITFSTTPSEYHVLIVNILESFFNESIGLRQTIAIEEDGIDLDHWEIDSKITKLLDTPDVGFALVPHLDELVSYVIYLSQGDSYCFRSPGATKKLRPSAVGPMILHSPLDSFGDHSALRSGSITIASLKSVPEHDFMSIQSKLHNQFFHQHSSLKTVCDFVAVSLVKNLKPQLIHKCINPLLPSLPLQNHQIHEVRTVLIRSCINFLSNVWENQIRSAITTLSPTECCENVLEMAVELMTNMLKIRGMAIISSLVDDHVPTIFKPLGSNQGKRLFTTEIASKVVQLDYYFSLSEAMADFTERIDKLETDEESCVTSLTSLSTTLKEMPQSAIYHIPPERSLRQFFSSLLLFDDAVAAMVKWTLDDTKGPKKNRWNLLLKIIEILKMLERISHRGLRKVAILFNDAGFLVPFIRLGFDAQKDGSLSKTLCQLLDSNLISLSQLDIAIQESGESISLSKQVE